MEWADTIVNILMGVLVVLGVIGIAQMMRAKGRHEKELAKFAAGNGFGYFPSGNEVSAADTRWKYTRDGRYDAVWFLRYAEFFPFSTLEDKKVGDLIVKREEGREWRMFRLRVGDRGRDSSPTWYWICVVELSYDFPALQVRPTGFLDKVVGVFGKKDIQTGSGEFDDKFHVSGEDESFARDFLDSGMKRFLLDQGTFRWQVRGPYAMLVWPHTYEVKDVELMLFAMRRFVAAMSEGVVGQ